MLGIYNEAFTISQGHFKGVCPCHANKVYFSVSYWQQVGRCVKEFWVLFEEHKWYFVPNCLKEKKNLNNLTSLFLIIWGNIFIVPNNLFSIYSSQVSVEFYHFGIRCELRIRKYASLKNIGTYTCLLYQTKW